MTVALRPEQGSDAPLLRQLFAESRQAELNALPDAQSRELFLSMQFEAQRRHLEGMHPHAERWIIEPDIGRMVLAETADGLHIVDLAVVSTEQGRGHGSSMLRALIDRADAAALPITLNVQHANHRARALYERHGFAVDSHPPATATASHLALRWDPRKKAHSA
ncbi:GNAT family N-acetyltransferase [Microterricola pindariensis]|uniref:N-acetyltransferase domain-containing protein n=1 Tax=Microterricola pindariensis TaxID=478010 RepID=A0ABX5AZX6_9MICO|nr:GNAT family N-acetyltransferase [Microterricola pindariensis]PPL20372.1 hypothetical protein GY24_00945 [Microterricola pindariensis]